MVTCVTEITFGPSLLVLVIETAGCDPLPVVEPPEEVAILTDPRFEAAPNLDGDGLALAGRLDGREVDVACLEDDAARRPAVPMPMLLLRFPPLMTEGRAPETPCKMEPMRSPMELPVDTPTLTPACEELRRELLRDREAEALLVVASVGAGWFSVPEWVAVADAPVEGTATTSLCRDRQAKYGS